MTTTRHRQTIEPWAGDEAAPLYATTPEPLEFAPALHIRAFLLRRDAGNVLIYSTGALVPGDPEIERLGGISRQYLNHGHEAMFGGDAGAPLFVHAADRDAVAERRPVRATFSKRHTLGDDLEVIPTPGHTPGATAYLWDAGGHRFLFTGDTILLHDGEWVAAVLGSSDREAYVASLELIRDLEFDVLVPWAASAGRPYYAFAGDGEGTRRIGAILDRVRGGAPS
jgi:glyoxylase-like metal-dependent hydrolase (beta-lactamase superfamily II)